MTQRSCPSRRSGCCSQDLRTASKTSGIRAGSRMSHDFYFDWIDATHGTVAETNHDAQAVRVVVRGTKSETFYGLAVIFGVAFIAVRPLVPDPLVHSVLASLVQIAHVGPLLSRRPTPASRSGGRYTPTSGQTTRGRNRATSPSNSRRGRRGLCTRYSSPSDKSQAVCQMTFSRLKPSFSSLASKSGMWAAP